MRWIGESPRAPSSLSTSVRCSTNEATTFHMHMYEPVDPEMAVYGFSN